MIFGNYLLLLGTCPIIQNGQVNVRSGYVGIVAGRFSNAGELGFGWSSRSHSEKIRSYDVYIRTSDVSTSDNINRWDGIPLRCLSTVWDIKKNPSKVRDKSKLVGK